MADPWLRARDLPGVRVYYVVVRGTAATVDLGEVRTVNRIPACRPEGAERGSGGGGAVTESRSGAVRGSIAA
ncbi:hypothetical protein FKR81_34170 [Lentzea tibetensis]|uniref:Uncharacterized protein n=1 Tax=Lentzea tibetensis TaxID=2591470 RepID=A0A563EJ52_9PSEU|nr:hypothetical protein [Lentzea tibetensis]TWP46858.1 hypothetical protein FKR81_34170 [Lentzea tibetensis]